MLTHSVETIGEQLRNTTHVPTNWTELGLEFDSVAADRIIALAPENLQRPWDETDINRESRAVSPACQEAARDLMRPLIDAMFPGVRNTLARARWELFGVNYYETGQFFPRHQDFRKSTRTTVLIASLSGVRTLKVDDEPELTLVREDITLLNGLFDPWHSATCIEGPSISVVVDVPTLPYQV